MICPHCGRDLQIYRSIDCYEAICPEHGLVEEG